MELKMFKYKAVTFFQCRLQLPCIFVRYLWHQLHAFAVVVVFSIAVFCMCRPYTALKAGPLPRHSPLPAVTDSYTCSGWQTNGSTHIAHTYRWTVGKLLLLLLRVGFYMLWLGLLGKVVCFVRMCYCVCPCVAALWYHLLFFFSLLCFIG